MPAPLGPMMAAISPARDGEAHAFERLHRAEAHADPVDFQQRRGPSHRAARRRHLGLGDAHVRPHGADASVLVGDLSLHVDVLRAGVEPLDERRVLLADEPAPHLARAGDLLVVRVQLLVEEEELPDLRPRQLPLAGEAAVHAVHRLADEVVHLRLLGEVGVGGVGDAPPLRPVAHRGEVDVEQRDHVGAPVTDAHRLLDERRELELVLEVLRREEGPAREPADVAGPVDDLEMSRAVDDAGVAGVHPAVLERLPRGVRVLVVAAEHAGAPEEHLAGVRGDPHLHARQRRARPCRASRRRPSGCR